MLSPSIVVPVAEPATAKSERFSAQFARVSSSSANLAVIPANDEAMMVVPAARRMRRTAMAKHRSVQVLIKPASADCNMACHYCFYLSKSDLYPESRPPNAADVQEEMTRQLFLYGGDQPLRLPGRRADAHGTRLLPRAVDLSSASADPARPSATRSNNACDQ